jgi:hypothetical protein
MGSSDSDAISVSIGSVFEQFATDDRYRHNNQWLKSVVLQEQCDVWIADSTDQDAESEEVKQKRHEPNPRCETASSLDLTLMGVVDVLVFKP